MGRDTGEGKRVLALQALRDGMAKRTIIIAEIGENHLGDMARARKMVEEAARAGADIAKFQSYLGSDVAPDDPEREWFTKVQLSDEAHRGLKECAEKSNIEFMSAPFSLGRAKFLCEGLGLAKVKVGSSEMLNFGLLDYLNGRVQTLFLSTGMANMEEIESALQHVKKVRDCYIMHCVTQYPTKPQDVNLNAITALKKRFPKHHIGYSDHTTGILAPMAAVALGAEVIEKHFTLDKSLPGTDHVLSATPAELKELVANVRQIELMLGSPEKKPTKEEAEITGFVRSRFPK